MLDRLPIEILHKVFYSLDSKPFQQSPAYHFYYPSTSLLPLSQVNESLRDAVGPLLYSHVSLVREYEKGTSRSELYGRAYRRLEQLRYARKYITELEIPDTMPLSDLDGLEDQLVSLIILGGVRYRIDLEKHLKLDHLALSLSNVTFQVKGLKRLDLLIDASTLTTLSSFNSFSNCPIEELNITAMNFPLLSKSNSFQEFLLALQPTLRKLSYRRTRFTPRTSMGYSLDEGMEGQTPNNNDLKTVLNTLQLTHLSIDLYFLSNGILESIRTHNDVENTERKPLQFTIRESSLAGLLTTEELNRITEFCSDLSTYQIVKVIFAFGVQTEIPYHTSISILQNLFKFSHDISKNTPTRPDPFASLKQAGTHMIWSIIDDSVFMESSRTKEHPLLSYETNAHYNPSFRILENFKIVRDDDNDGNSNRPVQLIRENSEVDYEFWSRENQSVTLTAFIRSARSSLWD